MTFIPGSSGKDVWAKVVPLDGLAAFARLLRDYHDAVADFRPTRTVWAAGTKPLAPGEIVCHGDFGPWNTVWSDDKPVAILDWDEAGPRQALYDVAYALEYTAPFRDDQESVRWLHYPEPPDRARRVETFCAAYGLSSTDGIVDEVIAVQENGIAAVRSHAAAGRQPQVQWVADGHLEVLAARATWTRENRVLFEA